MKTATIKAVEIAGGPTALARSLGITRQAVEQWERIPPERVLEVERLTGVTRYDLRPDIYGPMPGPLARKASSYQPAA